MGYQKEKKVNYIFTHYSGNFKIHHRDNERGILRLFTSVKKHLTNFKILFFTQNNIINEIPISILKFVEDNKDIVEIVKSKSLDISVGLHCQRYFYYYLYLHNNRKKFSDNDRFFHIDASDVIFQNNIFDKVIPNNKIHVFYEHKEVTFSKSYLNKKWIDDIKPNSSETIGNASVCCSGTVLIDNLEQFENFLLEMSWAMLRVEKTMSESLHDQALYNLILHGGLQRIFIDSDSLEFHNNEYPELVYTMQGVTGHDYTVTDTGISVNNIVPCVLHQYDRHYTLFPLFDKIYNLTA